MMKSFSVHAALLDMGMPSAANSRRDKERRVAGVMARRMRSLNSSPSTSTSASTSTYPTTTTTAASSTSPTTATRSLSPTSLGDRLTIPSLPGLKTSAAFLHSLSTNLCIEDESTPCPSPFLPPTRPSKSHSRSISLPSASHFKSSYTSPSAPQPTYSISNNSTTYAPNMTSTAEPTTLPVLETCEAIDRSDREAALRLIADSVAQQRQSASYMLIFHPINLSLFVLLVAIVVKYMYNSRSDLGIIATTLSGITMAALAGVRWLTTPYIGHAETIGWDFFGEGDTILVTKWGEDVIGALAMSWVLADSDGRSGSPNGRRKSGRGKVAVIKAWTVKLKYRGNGIGTGLLEEAVAVVNQKAGVGIEFADNHANSKRILHPVYHTAFDKQEKKGEDQLRRVIDSHGGRFARRKSKDYHK